MEADKDTNTDTHMNEALVSVLWSVFCLFTSFVLCKTVRFCLMIISKETHEAAIICILKEKQRKPHSAIEAAC